MIKAIGRFVLGLGLSDADVGRRIAFIHIPKCAGSAAAESLKRTYFPVRRELYRRWFERSAYSYEEISASASLATARAIGWDLQDMRSALLFYQLSLRSAAYVTGHIPFSRTVAEAYCGQWSFVTTLREPIERFFSEYFYNYFKQSSHFKVTEDLPAYLETPDARRTASQLTNFLTGRTDVYSQPTSQDVEVAIENLRRFAVVGFVDSMERFADDLARQFGKRPSFPIVNRNPAPYDARARQHDPVVRKKVSELSAADLEIYRRSREMLGFAPS